MTDEEWLEMQRIRVDPDPNNIGEMNLSMVLNLELQRNIKKQIRKNKGKTQEQLEAEEMIEDIKKELGFK